MTKLPGNLEILRPKIIRIGESFRHFSGRPLVPAADDIVSAMWTSPQVIVAHGTAPDPVFFFGNRAALDLFELDFAAFTRLPSRLSAEPMLREERARLLERVERDGMISDYSGVRVSSTGKRFRIAQAYVWNVIDTDGTRIGQAAAFSDWTALGGT